MRTARSCGPRSTRPRRAIARFEDELKDLLLPKDPNEGKNVILEIRGAEGGEEANLFAKDLFEMYVRFAERQGIKVEVLGTDPSDMGGFNEVTFILRGRRRGAATSTRAARTGSSGYP